MAPADPFYKTLNGRNIDIILHIKVILGKIRPNKSILNDLILMSN